MNDSVNEINSNIVGRPSFIFYSSLFVGRAKTILISSSSSRVKGKTKSLRQAVTENFHYNAITRLSTCLIGNCGASVTGKSGTAMKDHLIVHHHDICEHIISDFGDEAFELRFG